MRDWAQVFGDRPPSNLTPIVLAACFGAAACGKQDVAPTPTKSESSSETNPGGPAARALECERLLNARDFEALKGCYADPYVRVDIHGKEHQGAADEIARLQARSELAKDLEERTFIAIESEDEVFRLFFETGSFSGDLEGEKIDSEPFGLMSVTFDSGLDDEGAFHGEREYVDPNLIMHQVGKAVRTSHEPFSLPDGKPRVLRRDDAKAKAAIEVAKARVDATNAHDFEGLAKTYADDVVAIVTSNAYDARGKVGVLAGVPQGWAAFPDVKVEVRRMWGAEDLVVVEGSYKGTNRGDLGPTFDASGKAFEQHFVELIEVTNGKITKLYRVVDTLAVARQIGLLDAAKGGESGDGGTGGGTDGGTGSGTGG